MEIVVHDPGQPPRRVRLSLPATVGRSSSNTVTIANPAVSSHHGSFVEIPGGTGFVDTSSNGTILNGSRIAPNVPQPVVVGDRLKLGPVEIVVEMVTLPVSGPPVMTAPKSTAIPAVGSLRVQSRSGDRLVPLTALPLMIGRAPSNGLVLDDALASSTHGQIVALPNGFGYVDLGSRNGSRINGSPITPHQPVPVDSNDVITIGEVVLSLAGVPLSPQSTADALDAIAPGLELTLATPSGSRSASYADLPVSVGRSPDSGLVIDDPLASSRHGVFLAAGQVIGYQDLGSRNGSKLNGSPIPPHQVVPLAPGDQLTIGGWTISLAGVPAAYPPPSYQPETYQQQAPPAYQQQAPIPDVPVWTAPVPESEPSYAPRRRGAGAGLLAAVAGVVLLCGCAGLSAAGLLVVAATRGDSTTTSTSSKPAPTARPGIAAPEVDGVTRDNKDGTVSIGHLAAQFTMGSDSGELDELPVRQARTDAFWIDRSKITVEQFASFARSNKVEGKWNSNEGAKVPAVGITYADAENYCKSQGRRLPTEEEWERAARGTDGRIYPWGNAWDPSLFDAGKVDFTATVPTYVNIWGPVGRNAGAAGPTGVLDLAGGPKEWIGTFYNAYSGGPAIPVAKDKFRVTRGGFRPNNIILDARASARDFHVPTASALNVGFRCAG